MTRPGASIAIARHHRQPGGDGTFDLSIDGERLGHLVYSLPDNATLTIDYVHVDPSLRGQGMGQKLVDAAIEWAREQERHVIPLCSYARAVMARKDQHRKP